MWTAAAEDHKLTDLSYSLGFKVKDDGAIVDVIMGGPAQKAGVAPSTQLIAVDNRQFTPAVLRAAVEATAAASKTLDLLVKNGEYYEVRRIEYAGGEKFPSLVRDPAASDLLSQIIAPAAKK
jgi:predicted metalloprotease with PDZ domain